jgi:hypothetical protein
MEEHRIINVLLFVVIGVAIWYFANKYWRKQAIGCATEWALQNRCKDINWSGAKFEMHRQNPCITFKALCVAEGSVEIKLRLKAGLLGGYSVDEVALKEPV